MLLLSSLLALSAGPPALRTPRDADSIRLSLATGLHDGDCDRCHSMHGTGQVTVFPNALKGPNDNSLCIECHDRPWTQGSFAVEKLYLGTGHGSSTSMVWPGPVPPMRLEPDAATKCVNCHDPHGVTDAQGVVPRLALRREEQLCLACHDGSPASANIAAEFSKPYRHPTLTIAGRHTGADEQLPSEFGVTPVNQRHAECEDCHNPHVSRADRSSVEGTTEASRLVLGVSRVAVSNGGAGSRPLYTLFGASDSLSSPNAEYQLCFKCHSSWTTQPSGQTDMGLVLNPANPSYHPVEDIGRNLNISPMAFTPGWSATSITRCGSCHGSDFGGVAGPHGSTNAGLLRRPSPASASERTMSSDELCFACHDYDVYANPSSPSTTRAASRFNAPNSEMGHAEHVGEERVPCYACHVTHGSTTQPNLLVLGRSPGLITYTRTASGGTCTASCHGSESYTVNYAR